MSRLDLQDLLGRTADVIALGLEPTRAALAALGHPERAYRCAIVAGTNGKGSVCAFLAAMLEASGVRTGLYTSPHLVSACERVRVGGVDVSEVELRRALDAVLACEPGLPRRLTFFEVLTVAALWHFREAGVHTAILEVGLGGRLDATNAAEPAACAITSIGWDHMELLGDTLGAIAREKAGILRRGVPCIVAPANAEVRAALLASAAAAEAPLVWSERAWLHGRPAPVLEGEHQLDNAAVAIGVARALGIPDFAIDRGLREARWAGRCQRISRTLLDGAHNPDGVRALLAVLDADPTPRARTALVFSALSDKPVAAMLEALAPRFAHVHVTALGTPRSDARALAALASAHGAGFHATPAEAVRAARAAVGEDGLVVIAGSLYLLGEVLEGFSPGTGTGT